MRKIVRILCDIYIYWKADMLALNVTIKNCHIKIAPVDPL